LLDAASADRALAHALRSCAVALLAAAVALPAAAAQTPEARIELLEARVEALTARVAALEARGDDVSAAEPTEAGIAWQLGAGIDGRPLRVSYKVLDRDQGRIELLLEITEPLPDAASWQAGAPAPIAVTLRAPDGTERALPLTLLRGAKLAPGGHLHLAAELDPALAAGATQLRIHRIAEP
jgi:hypothetical protein